MAWQLMGTFSEENYDREYGDRELIKRLIPYLSKYKKLTVLVFIVSVLSSIFSLLSPLILALALNELILKKHPNLTFILFATISYLAVLIISWLDNYIYAVQSSILEANIIFRFREELFKKVNLHDLSFFDKNKTGKIMNRITDDTSDLGNLYSNVVDLTSTVIQAGLIIGTMLLINAILTVITLVIFPILFFVAYLLRRIVRRYSTLQRRASASVNSAVEESINGIQITKTFGKEKSIIEHYNTLQMQKTAVNIKQSIIYGLFSPTLDLINALGLFIILYVGGLDTLLGIITPGYLYLFYVYIQRLFQPLIDLSTFYTTLQDGFAAGERIFSMMDVPVIMKVGSLKVETLKGEIDFQKVNFTYDKNVGYVFKDFNLYIPEGQVLAVVGETGAGKTSFASILTRMYEFESGQIILDGQYNIQDIEPDCLRNQIGYVLQDPFLFSGTIRENLILGSPNATDQAIQDSLKAVRADSFIDLLPLGIQSPVLERGKGFSQGQKQLIALARVLIKDPKILVLDEATSSVDVYTEKMIQDALNLVFKNRTTIIIAHRLSTILNADRIIVIEKGELVEEGKHTELIMKDGKYRKLYETYYAHQGALEEMQIQQTTKMTG